MELLINLLNDILLLVNKVQGSLLGLSLLHGNFALELSLVLLGQLLLLGNILDDAVLDSVFDVMLLLFEELHHLGEFSDSVGIEGELTSR